MRAQRYDYFQIGFGRIPQKVFSFTYRWPADLFSTLT